MAIVLRCECGNEFKSREENAGRPARCPVCQRDRVVPEAKLPPDAELAQFGDDRHSQTSGKAIASQILGLCSFFGCCLIQHVPPIIVVAVCIGVLAIILGVLGLGDINNPKKGVAGKGKAITGIVLGACTTIVTVLAALAAEGVEPGNRSRCANNLKQIGLALENYHSQYGAFPPAARYDPNGKPLLSCASLSCRTWNNKPFTSSSTSTSRGTANTTGLSPIECRRFSNARRSGHCLKA